jgi:eukaryotic-like serine/threonine-protein kinase
LLEPGQIFAARYRVSRQIAEGGMGVIYEAEHTATERRVALKLLFPHVLSVASARQKFELEAKISARVNSPYIVEVLDAGFDEATRSPYLVMELLEGQTIAAHVEQKGSLTIDQALPLLEQVAAGLDAAHGYKEANGTAKPIVHRDLKPENLFMAREHGAHVVKILDFGIAKVLGETSNVSQEVRGTPLYMAIEQLTAGALSPQTDVWALGLIAYYMFTGSPYWRSAHQQAASMQSLFAEILSLPLEAPSLRVRQQSSSVALPAAFDAWLLTCIERDPSRRYASAGRAIDELARAFGKVPRPRGRLSVRSLPALSLAKTEAFVSPAPALGPIPAPAPVPAAAPVAAAQAEAAQAGPGHAEPAQGPAAMPTQRKLGTLGTLPGMVSEQQSPSAPAPRTARTRRWAAMAAGGALVLCGVIWLAASGTAPPHAEAEGASASPPRAHPASAGAGSAGVPTVAAAGDVANTAPLAAAPSLPSAPALGQPAPAAPSPGALSHPDGTPQPTPASSTRLPGSPPPRQTPAPASVSSAPEQSSAAARLPTTPPQPRVKAAASMSVARKPAPTPPVKPSTRKSRSSASDAYRMR